MTKKAGLFIIGSFLLTLYCIIPEGPESSDPEVTIAGDNDTISPFTELVITFSEPVVSSSDFCLDFSPPLYSYSVALNQAGDTARVTMGVKLEGDTRYTLRFCESITTESGSTFKSGKDSLVFFTFASEQEPNDTLLTADTVFDFMTGSLSTVDDIDCFFLEDTTVNTFYFEQYGVSCSLLVRDGEGVSSLAQETEDDLYDIPAELNPPFFLHVHSKAGSSGGYYLIRLVRD